MFVKQFDIYSMSWLYYWRWKFNRLEVAHLYERDGIRSRIKFHAMRRQSLKKGFNRFRSRRDRLVRARKQIKVC